MRLDIKIDAESMLQVLADLKGIKVSKVVRNAARDFAFAAQKYTPLADKSKSEYYRYYDKAGNRHYLHESQIKGKPSKGLKRVRIYKGWSKASWIGVFRALGISAKGRPSSVPAKAEQISNAITRGGAESASTTLTDYIHFDQFGRGMDNTSQKIVEEGFKRASENITKEIRRMLLKGGDK